MLPVSPSSSSSSFVTRLGVLPVVIPSQSAMASSTLQFSVPVPRNSSKPSAVQSNRA